MTLLVRLPALVSCLLLGAHFLRAGEYGLLAVWLVAPLLLSPRQRWTTYVLSGLLLLGSIEWLLTAIELYGIRQSMAQPATRMLLILAGVAGSTLLSSLLLLSKNSLKRSPSGDHDAAVAAAFFLAAFIMSLAHLVVETPILLLERFVPSFGWLEIFGLSMYAAWIAGRMLDRSLTTCWRRRIWALFSIIFFAQLTLGLSGLEKFLMTGTLHLPVPAMIIAGPIYRGNLSIMVFLFAGSILLLGPAWCSYLCYIGIWDDLASRSRRIPRKLTMLHQWTRIGVLIIVILAALVLNLIGMRPIGAAMAGLGFGLIGVAIMMTWSRRKGVMTHCVTYCPIGLVAVTLGKINPFRIRISDECTNCGLCRPACRYNALNMADIRRRRPNLNCTLCGDCIGSCEDGFIEYRFPGLARGSARTLFIVIAISLHAAFLATGRI